MIDTKIFSEIIESTFIDIRAEVIIADLIENGLDWGDYVAIHNGNFKRRYSRDIAAIEQVKLDKNQELLGFRLNRDSLYDSLPEGLFHKKSGAEGIRSKKLSEDSVVLKQEEKAARNFFLPFENEIFLQRVKLELEERKILGRFSENIFNDLYPILENLHRSIKREYVYRMILLLHMAHEIAGNYELTALCLQKIIEENVSIRILKNSNPGEKYQTMVDASLDNKLGEQTLGVNLICGNLADDFVKGIEFIIGPLSNTKAEDYLPDASVSRFLEYFYSYFVPVEMNIKTRVILADDELNMTLLKKGEGPVLGYETAI